MYLCKLQQCLYCFDESEVDAATIEKIEIAKDLLRQEESQSNVEQYR
jgi:Trp operon repressor